MHGSVYAVARGPLARCMDPASVTGRRDPGEPLGWPVKAFPAPVSVSKTPYVRASSDLKLIAGPPAVRSGPPFLTLGSRANVLVAFRRPPHLLESPLRPSPSEGLRKVCFSPISLSISVSNFWAQVLPFAPGSWPLSITKRGRADPRKRP